jgi:hypothetical protein
MNSGNAMSLYKILKDVALFGRSSNNTVLLQ